MERYKQLCVLTGPSENDLMIAMDRLCRKMEKLSFDTIVRLKTVECSDPIVVTIEKTGKNVELSGNKEQRAELEILSKPECWWEILRGQLSPVEAFLKHRLRVRGDIEIAKKILLEIGEPKGIVDPCTNDSKGR